MVITLKRLEEEIERVNVKLQELCESNIKAEYYNPDYFPGVIITKDGVRLSEIHDGACHDCVHFGCTKREVHTALERVLKFLWARDEAETAKTGKSQRGFITDCEVCGIFGAAFWR